MWRGAGMGDRGITGTCTNKEGGTRWTDSGRGSALLQQKQTPRVGTGTSRAQWERNQTGTTHGRRRENPQQ